MISRRNLLTAAPASGMAVLRGAVRRPNIIVILMDDLGVHDLGCLGASDLKTPNIDSLAAGGARFTNWYSNAPVCAPSRAALMTGRCPIRAGVGINGRPLRPSEKTIASLLKPAGYRTALTGKWHLGSTPESWPNAHGFDYFYGFYSGCVDFYSHRYYWGEPRQVNYHDLWRNREEIFENGRYLTERIAEEAAGFVEREPSRPLFLYCAFNAVHYPMHAPPNYVERFPGLERERRMYAAMLAAADDGVGRILRALERTGQRDNTLIWFGGDNGATTEPRAGLDAQPATAGSNAPFRGYKFSVFDGGMHVPAILNWPGVIPRGALVKEIAMTADLLPTVCGVAGTEVPSDRTIDGRNILPLAVSGAPSPHSDVCWAEGPQRAIRRGRWKLVLNGITHDRTPEAKKPLAGEDAVFLSDLDEDPGESHNLRRKHPDIVDELSTAVARWREQVEDN